MTVGLFEILAQRLDIGRDMQRLDIGDLVELVMIAPGEEPYGRVIVRQPRVLVADRGGEEFKEATRGLVAGLGDHARHPHLAAQPIPCDDANRALGPDDDDLLAHAN